MTGTKTAPPIHPSRPPSGHARSSVRVCSANLARAASYYRKTFDLEDLPAFEAVLARRLLAWPGPLVVNAKVEPDTPFPQDYQHTQSAEPALARPSGAPEARERRLT